MTITFIESPKFYSGSSDIPESYGVADFLVMPTGNPTDPDTLIEYEGEPGPEDFHNAPSFVNSPFNWSREWGKGSGSENGSKGDDSVKDGLVDFFKEISDYGTPNTSVYSPVCTFYTSRNLCRLYVLKVSLVPSNVPLITFSNYVSAGQNPLIRISYHKGDGSLEWPASCKNPLFVLESGSTGKFQRGALEAMRGVLF